MTQVLVPSSFTNALQQVSLDLAHEVVLNNPELKSLLLEFKASNQTGTIREFKQFLVGKSLPITKKQMKSMMVLFLKILPRL